MKQTKIVAIVLCLAMGNTLLARMAFADGDRAGTTEEAMDYGQREAQAADLEGFLGGSGLGAAAIILFIIGIGANIWYVLSTGMNK